MCKDDADREAIVALMDKVSAVFEDQNLGIVMSALLTMLQSTMLMKLDLSDSREEWAIDNTVFQQEVSRIAARVAAFDYDKDRDPSMSRYQVEEKPSVQ